MLNKKRIFSFLVACLAALTIFSAIALERAVTDPVPVVSASDSTAAATAAAQAYIASLTPDQRAKAVLPYDAPTKSHWHNFPPVMARRPGIAFSDLTPQQRELGFNLLKAILSPYGYQKITDITSADEYLGTKMGPGGFPTGPNAYLLAIFGTPSTTAPWAIQYGGHHLGLNVAISGSNHVLAPTLTGAYPNIYTKDGKEIFVLHDEVDRAQKLVNSLAPAERSKAIASMQIWNFVLGPGHDGQVVQPEGLKGSEMTADQKEQMIGVAAAWVNVMNQDAATRKLAEIRQHIDDTYFLWSGDTKERGMAYFRIQGPTVWIEYSPQTLGGPGSILSGQDGRGGDRGGFGRGNGRGGPPQGGPQGGQQGNDPNWAAQFANTWPPPDLPENNDPNRVLDKTHVHTVYRDFTDDYGVKFASASH